jgi:hypothetical protein
MVAQPGAQLPAPDFGQMRASSADRERAVDVLKAAFAEGRLDMDEYADRVGRVHLSRTYAELAAITADLPVGPLGTLPVAAAPAPPAVAPAYPVMPAMQAAPVARTQRSGASSLAAMSMIMGMVAVVFPELLALAFPGILAGLMALPATAPGRKHGRSLAVIGLALGALAFFRVG